MTRSSNSDEALRASEQRLRDLFEHSPDALVIVDLQAGRFLDANARAERLFGMSRRTLRERGPLDLTPELQPDGRLSADVAAVHEARLLADGGVQFPWLHVDGAGREFECEVALVRLPGRSRPMALGRVADISHRRAMERQLHQAHRMEAVGHLARGLAHDFNNQLAVIIGCVDLVRARLGGGHAALPELDMALEAGERAATMARHLLTFGRRQPLAPEPLDLNDVIRANERIFARILGEHVTLELQCDPEPQVVRLDLSHVEQALANLVLNARDAMPEGGRCTIATDRVLVRAEDPGRPNDQAPGWQVRLRVIDTGVGMDARTAEQAFDPFFSTKGLPDGPGLGLAVVHGFVRQSGGHVAVQSQPGAGTTVDCQFPLVQVADPAAQPPVLSAEMPGGSETVLVADDDRGVAAVVRATLEDCGYRVLSAPDPQGVLQLCDTHTDRIHLLLTDVIMPGLNGRELADRVTLRRSDVRVLFMSGYPDDVIADYGVLGADVPFLAKPFTPGKLARAVRSAIDARVAAPRGG